MEKEVNEWISVNVALPPNEEGWTPQVWLALDDSTVCLGEGLHRPKGATYEAPMHDWFVNGRQLSIDHPGCKVIAWQALTPPVHPYIPRPARITLRD